MPDLAVSSDGSVDLPTYTTCSSGYPADLCVPDHRPFQKASVLESAPQPKSPVAKLSLWPVMVMSEKSGSAFVNDGSPPLDELVR